MGVRPCYRVRQGLRALVGGVRPAERIEAAAILGPELLPLFSGMTRPWQRHHLDVCRRLRWRGDQALLQAALLHDVGKGRLSLVYRVLPVLLQALAPAVLRSLGAEGKGTWREGFSTEREHAALGAKLAASAGAGPAVVDLIARHHQPAGDDRRLAILQAADDES